MVGAQRALIFCLAASLLFTACSKDIAQTEIDNKIQKFGKIEKHFLAVRPSCRTNETGNRWLPKEQPSKGFMSVDFTKGEVFERAKHEPNGATATIERAEITRETETTARILTDISDGSKIQFFIMRQGEKWRLLAAEKFYDIYQNGVRTETYYIRFE